MTEIIRTSIRLTKDMHDWYKDEAAKIGIPMNAMLLFALKQYQREESILPNIPEIIQAMAMASQIQSPVELVKPGKEPHGEVIGAVESN